MSIEKPNLPTSEEQAEIEKTRVISDAELLKDGVEYKTDEATGEKRLKITNEQIEGIHKEFEDIDNSRAFAIFKQLSPLNEGLNNTGVAVGLRDSSTVQDILFYKQVAFHDGQFVLEVDTSESLDLKTGRSKDTPDTTLRIPLKDVKSVFFIDHRISISFDEDGEEVKK